MYKRQDIALAVSKAAAQKEKQINEMDRQIYDLTGRIEHAKQETRLREQNIKEQYEERLRMKDEEIAYYKDFKARQSTKMIGESLEPVSYTHLDVYKRQRPGSLCES